MGEFELMTTIDDMQVASEEIGAILDDLEECVFQTETTLTKANGIGEVSLKENLARPLAWKRIKGKFCIALVDDGEWQSWHDATARRRIEAFQYLPALIVKIEQEVKEVLGEAMKCRVVLAMVDTLLGAPAPASGGEGES